MGKHLATVERKNVLLIDRKQNRTQWWATSCLARQTRLELNPQSVAHFVQQDNLNR